MPFQWTVDPYSFRTQMRSNYTRLLLLTGSGVGSQQAKDAEAWMKQNAPWEDLRPDAPPSRKARSRHARKNLVGETGETKEDKKLREGLEREGKRRDAEMLANLNRKRSLHDKGPLNRLPKAQRSTLGERTKFPIMRIILRHGTTVAREYGLWLEVGNQGRYAIIAPAVSYWGAKTMQTLQRIINLGQFSVSAGGSEFTTIVNEPGTRLTPYRPGDIDRS